MNNPLEVADILRLFGPAYVQKYGSHLPLRHLRAMGAIKACRTAALGGHVDQCDQCGAVRISYNSCRNRHCPKCQSLAKERWIEARKADVLPVPYFHVVFTLPQELRPVALRNQRVLYNLLFKAAWQTLNELGKDSKYLGAQIGVTGILHTWSQTLVDHPHLHCVVTGGGLSKDGKRWISARRRFFLPVRVVSRLFRGKFLAYLKEAYDNEKLGFPGQIAILESALSFQAFLDRLYQIEWTVYCKPPFGGPEQVIDYLGRYTHRIALSNDRLLACQDNYVMFCYRDRLNGSRVRILTLHALEFIRRFLLHVLPGGFVKIRHYGILSNKSRRTKLNRSRVLLGGESHGLASLQAKKPWQDLLAELTGVDPRKCPYCGKGTMVLRETILPHQERPPPAWLSRTA